MAQQGMNTQAAVQQQRMNMTGQNTPYGSLSYSTDPNSPSGYTATQTYTPEVQRLISTGVGNAQGSGDIEHALLGNVQSTASKPLDLSWGATEANIDARNRHTLDPLWSERQNTFDQTAANRGLVPGSAAYDSAARDFGMQRDNSYNDMYLKGHETAVNDISQQYNSPFNALASLRSSSMMPNQPSMGLTTTPQESVAAPNYMGAVNQNFQNQTSQYNAMLGGLFGLGGAVLGAPARFAGRGGGGGGGGE
jgi:hypothetical protein